MRFGWLSRDAPQLELLRIGLGLAILVIFIPLTPHLEELYGDDGWVSRKAFETLRLEDGWYSALAYCHGSTILMVVHASFLTTAVAFTMGWAVRWVKWPLWLLYVSYLNRSPALVYGVDLLIANLLLVVCIAPVGRWPTGPRARVCLILVRWQMALVFFFTAVQKLRGELWWSGDAVWVALNNTEFSHTAITEGLAQHFWLVNVATHAALLFELAYPFLIWGCRTRAWMLIAAITFHLGTAVLFGLYLFAWVAIVGHLSFVPTRLIEAARALLQLERDRVLLRIACNSERQPIGARREPRGLQVEHVRGKIGIESEVVVGIRIPARLEHAGGFRRDTRHPGCRHHDGG